METLVILMMLMVGFCFVLKQTFHGVREVMVMAVIVLFFVGLMWEPATEQSKTQIAAWIADTKLMLDMAVLMSIDVALTMFFCVMHVDVKTAERVSHWKRAAYLFLKYFPGLLIFPVLFSVLVMLIFLLPGVSFQVVAWGLGAVLFVALPSLTYGMRWLLPERPIRLEMLFLAEVLLGLMGIIGTVNGNTGVAAVSGFDLPALLAVVAMVAAGGVVGYFYENKKRKKI